MAVAVDVDVRSGGNLLDQLNSSITEKDVENAWRQEFSNWVPEALISSPHKSDGVLQAKTLHVLLEFKFDLDFKQRSQVMRPVIQSLLYLKKFLEGGSVDIPTSLFVGDRNECFMLPTLKLTPYLDREDIDWDGVAPSQAWKDLPELFRELILDKDINPYVLDVRERDFYFKDIIDKLESFHQGRIHQVPITIHNISGIYTSWQERVLSDPSGTDAMASVGAFVASILGEAYLHPKKANTLVTGDTEVRVNGQQHKAFFKWFQNEYRVSEKKGFTAIKDRLIADDVRRRSGDFYTPTIWVDEAHKLLDKELGKNWRDEWVVWDCAAGSGNLTRDYNFKELYLSTLYQEDVDTIEAMSYNPGAEVFQFDFLNDPIPGEGLFGDFIDITNPLPPKLLESLRAGKKFVFLINPPFGTASAGGANGANKDGVSSTVVRESMDLGHAKQQLYAQFMFRITEIVKRFDPEDAVFALYSVPLFFSGPSFKKFRKYFYDRWEFKDGFLFRADEFNGTSSSWGCSHTLWRKGKDTRTSFDLTLKERDEHGVVQDTGTKAFYYAEESASEWVKAPRSMWWGKGTKDVPQFTSAVRTKYKGRGSICKGSLGCMANNSNNVYANQGLVILFSGAIARDPGVHVFPKNFRRCVALFTARKSIKSNWINQKDEYCAPNTDHPDYDQWVNDSIVYSLFHSSSQQSSLRNIDYKGDSWNIENEFFWMSNEEMRDLADEYGFNELYQDTLRFISDRYVFKELENLKLSPDAKEILDLSRKLIKDAMPFREQAHTENPQYHLHAWDAGWTQVRRGILEQYFPNEYEEFKELYRTFEVRMRAGVFEFGFLKS